MGRNGPLIKTDNFICSLYMGPDIFVRSTGHSCTLFAKSPQAVRQGSRLGDMLAGDHEEVWGGHAARA